MDNTLRTLCLLYWAKGDGIVRPVLKKMDQPSRRLHHSMPPVILTGGIFFYHGRHGAIAGQDAFDGRCGLHRGVD
jgi:hypothetical protein